MYPLCIQKSAKFNLRREYRVAFPAKCDKTDAFRRNSGEYGDELDAGFHLKGMKMPVELSRIGAEGDNGLRRIRLTHLAHRWIFETRSRVVSGVSDDIFEIKRGEIWQNRSPANPDVV